MTSSRLFVATCAVTLMTTACAGNLKPQEKQPPLPPTAPSTQPPPPPQARAFTATAYCQGTRTASGTRPTAKTVAADPAVLPLGSRIRLSGLHEPYNGDYIVEDTGAKVRGRRVDLYVRDCREAVRFGRRSASVAMLQK